VLVTGVDVGVDRAVCAALATDAEILIVPNLAMLDGPLAALLRW